MMKVEMRLTSSSLSFSFLFFVFAFATLSLVDYCNGYHMLPEKSTFACLNDGFENADSTCQCKDSNYVGGTNCEVWGCINFGRPFVQSVQIEGSNTNLKTGCDCPFGFRGTHCEPTACIPNSENFIKAFNPVERSFSLIITYNDDFFYVIGRGKDNITNALLNMLGQAPFDSNIDRLHVQIIGSTDAFLPFDCYAKDGPLKDCFKDQLEIYIDFSGPPFPDMILTKDHLLSTIQQASSNSPVLLITNVPLVNATTDQDMNELARYAIARQVELTVIVAEPKTPTGQDIFFSPLWIPLIKLTRKTLGTFITPYQTNGGPYYSNVTVSTIINQFVPKIASKTLVDFGTWLPGNSNPSIFNLFTGNNDDRSIFISVAADQPNRLSDFNVDLHAYFSTFGSLAIPSIIDAGFWRLYKIPYTSTQSMGYQLFHNVSISTTFHIWSVSNSPGPINTQPHSYVGFLSDSTSDVNSPIIIYTKDQNSQITNTIVAHIYNVDPSLPQNIMASYSLTNSSQTITNSSGSVSRNCLFNLQFDAIQCSNPTDYGTIQITFTGSQSFQETLPIICGTLADTQMAFNISATDSQKLKLDVKEAVDDDDPPPEIEEFTCDNTALQYQFNPNSSKSFVFAFSNYKSLTTMLLNGTLNGANLFGVLNNYIGSYASDYFSTFILASFTTTSSFNPVPYDSYGQFRINLNFALQASSDIDLDCDPSINQGVDQASMLNSLISYPSTLAFSEIFFITNRNFPSNNQLAMNEIYKNIENYRIKINFLLYDDGSCNLLTNLATFYEIAARSGGNVMPFKSKEAFQQFFDTYQTRQRSQLVISSYDNSQPFVAVSSAGEFNYVQGKNYFITATVKNSTSIPLVKIRGALINDTAVNAKIVVGEYYGFFELPNNLATGRYSVDVYSFDYAPLFYVNIFEQDPSEYYVIGFSSTQTYDLEFAYPSYSGAKSRVFIVTKAPSANSSQVTITYPPFPKDSQIHQIYTGPTRQRQSCQYNLISDYKWLCQTLNQLYYVTIDTQTETFTSMFTCYGEGNNPNTTGNPGPGSCQNGGTPSGGVCICAPGFKGDNCGDPECFNGGSVTISNTCDCTEFYEGEHCEIATFQCQKDIPFPRYTSIIETFVFVVDLSMPPTFAGITEDSIPSVFQQYILVTATQLGGNDSANIQVYGNVKYFTEALKALKCDRCPGPFDSRIIIRKSLESIKTERSLLIWVAGQSATCGNADDSDVPNDELLNLIAKRKVEMRSFIDVSIDNSCFLSIAGYGNGVPLKYNNMADVFNYIKLLVPQKLTDTVSPTKNLVILDSYITDNCQNMDIKLQIEPLLVDQTDYEDLHIILYNLITSDLGPVDTMPSSSYVYKIDKNDFKLIPGTSGTYCGYIIEGRHSQRIAYEVTPSNFYESEGYGIYFSSGRSNLNFYLENGPKNASSFEEFPEVFTAEVRYENFTYQHAPVVNRNCMYPWSIEVICNDFVGPIKTKIYITDSAGYLHQRVLTTYCLQRPTCSPNGRKIYSDDETWPRVWACGCSPFWTGTDCSIPICLNGGTPNRESCNCAESYYGSNCEKKATATTTARLILLICDVTGSDEQLNARKELLSQFMDAYDGILYSTIYLSTNIENGKQISGNAKAIKDFVNNNLTLSSNENINLTEAFDYFLKQNLNGYSMTYFLNIKSLFYITHHSIDPNQNLAGLFDLQEKGFFMYSAYYYPNQFPDIPVLQDLSGFGGVTGSYNTYDVISDFNNILTGGKMNVVPTPSPTTPPPPIPCVKKQIMDIIVFVDPVVAVPNYALTFQVRNFLKEFAGDLKFADDGDKQGSRAVLAVVNTSAGYPLCTSTDLTFANLAQQMRFIPADEQTIDLTIPLQAIEAILGNGAVDQRKVPRFAIFITDRPLIANSTVAIAEAKRIAQVNSITFAVVGYGSGDFSPTSNFGQIVGTQGLMFSLTADYASFKKEFYDNICYVANSIELGDYNYVCPAKEQQNKINSYPNQSPDIPALQDLSGLAKTKDVTALISTTPPPQIPCIQEKTMDIFVFIDPIIAVENYELSFKIRNFLKQFAGDLKFADESDKNGSRAVAAVINTSAGYPLCTSTDSTFANLAQQMRLIPNDTQAINLDIPLQVIEAILGNEAVDQRKVPRFAIFITDRPQIENSADTIVKAKQIARANQINFAVIGFGSGNFNSQWGLIVGNQGLMFNLTSDTFKDDFYNNICLTANNIGVGDYDYVCPERKQRKTFFDYFKFFN